jgi:hypothetical protein
MLAASASGHFMKTYKSHSRVARDLAEEPLY